MFTISNDPELLAKINLLEQRISQLEVLLAERERSLDDELKVYGFQ